MSATEPKPYTIVGQPFHENRWDEGLREIVPGWTVKARWNATGGIIPVFVPDTLDLVSTADTLIRFQGAQLDALRAR